MISLKPEKLLTDERVAEIVIDVLNIVASPKTRELWENEHRAIYYDFLMRQKAPCDETEEGSQRTQ